MGGGCDVSLSLLGRWWRVGVHLSRWKGSASGQLLCGKDKKSDNDALPGPPTRWVPPGVPPSQISPSESRKIELAHIPLKRGGAHAADIRGWERVGAPRVRVVVVR